MAEVTNKTLALLVLAALAVVIIFAGVQLSGTSGLAGQPTGDTGDVTLTISGALAIEVDATNNAIAFGTCTPNGSLANISSDDTTSNSVCDGSAADGNTANVGSFIQVNNVGSVDANVTVYGECTPAQFIPEVAGSDADFLVRINGSGCSGTSAVSSYTSLSTSTLGACDNLTAGATNEMYMWARIQLPPDAQAGTSCGGDSTNTITFNATQSGA